MCPSRKAGMECLVSWLVQHQECVLLHILALHIWLLPSCHHDILEACLVGRSIDIQRRTEVVDHAQPIDVMPRILAAFVLKSHLLPPRQPGPRQSFGDRPHFRAYPLFPRQTLPELDDMLFMGWV